MTQPIEELLSEYKIQLIQNPATADKSLPNRAREMFKEVLEKQLTNGYVDKEVVHLSQDISYFFGGDKHSTVQALFQYLTQTLDKDEEAWARWELVDNLAMLRRCQEVVDNHRKFLSWAKNNLSPDRLLWVMYDSTQSFCWMKAGEGAAWVRVFYEILATTVPSADNRYERFLYLRTANRMFSRMGRLDEAWQTSEQILKLSEEDTEWEKSFSVKLEAMMSQILLCHEMGDKARFEDISDSAINQLMLYHDQQKVGTSEQRGDLVSLYHNLASTFYFTRDYERAIPLLRTTISLEVFEHFCYSWLAGALWATTRDRSTVIPLLHQAAHRTIGEYDAWKSLPEFQDVAQDQAFLQAVGLTEN